MPSAVSKRILDAIDALPLRPGLRVLEIGCGPGVAAREIVRRWPTVFVLGIDRSAKAIEQARAMARVELAQGRLEFRQTSAEAFELASGEEMYDFAFALRVGALDGRHPDAGAVAIPRIEAALKRRGRLFVDGGNPLRAL